MKINGLTNVVSYFDRIESKKDLPEHGSQQQHQQQPDQNGKDEQKEPTNPEQFSAEIEKAVGAFKGDPQAMGLTASTQGKGPGLKVVLKDPNGAVLREYTGEEFLRLRQASGSDLKGRGKILDRKL